jgi:hypothetical protein
VRFVLQLDIPRLIDHFGGGGTRRVQTVEAGDTGVRRSPEADGAKPATAGASADAGRMTAPASVDETVRSPGQTLDAATRDFMETRFGYDFGGVRVHADARAAGSARDIAAQAYNVGSHIVFGAGRFDPGSGAGGRLLAHELTHVVQQGATGRNDPSCSASSPGLQRFSDVDHHIIEEAALKKIFTDEEIAAIEKGNKERDYSQLSSVANALSLGQPTQFGGYAPEEHFDHFVFDRVRDRWVSQDDFDKIWDDHAGQWLPRSVPSAGPRKPRTTAPQYIEAQLLAAVQADMPDAAAFGHLGNAFHTVEDFFAHSNFVELAQGDLSHGIELATHASHVAGPGSEDSIVSTVFDPVSAAYFGQRFRRGQETASPLSHASQAKDFHGNRNHALAITLAALVIREVALAMQNAFALKTRELRESFVRKTVIARLNRYLRPPSDKDRWWATLQAEDRGHMRRSIQALQSQTPVTVNHTPASPLRNIEATRYSSWKAIGLGTSLSFSLGDGKFLTVGHMLSLPGTGGSPLQTGLMLPPFVADKDEPARLISGLQFSGTFDENAWFK